MQKSWGLYIGGTYQPAIHGATFTVSNPANGQALAQVSEASKEDVDKAVKAAQSAFTGWSALSGAERADIMNRVADLMVQRMPELIDLEIQQIGRPRREMQAQLARLPEWFRYFGAIARTHEGYVPPFSGSYVNYVRNVPLGVVGLITPWNHPLLILSKKIAPAMAAGNTMVIKPSELAPITPLLLGEIMAAAGVPDGVYNVVPGFGGVAGAALVTHQDIRKIDVTGGTQTGKQIAALAGANLVPVAAELGGKAAVILFADTAVERGVAGALFAAFIASGQTCVQGARILVQRPIYAAVIKELVRRLGSIRLGDPNDLQTQMGPLVSARQLALSEQYVAIGQAEGARLVYGGQRPSGEQFANGHYYLPTLFADVTPAMQIAQDEIFGPVVCVMPFDTEEQAIEIANATEFGLAASVWTNQLDKAHRVAQQIDAGVVWINDHHRIDPASPWGGFKQSGLGRENGQIAYNQYTQTQSVIVNLDSSTFDWYSDDNSAKRYS